jgi:hypothetical protein
MCTDGSSRESQRQYLRPNLVFDPLTSRARPAHPEIRSRCDKLDVRPLAIPTFDVIIIGSRRPALK